MFFHLQWDLKSWISRSASQGLYHWATGAPALQLYWTTSWVGWLFWAKRLFETVFQSISGRLPERGRKKREMIDKRKNVQTTPTRTYCKCSRPLPYCNTNYRTPRHWKFTQHHCTYHRTMGLSCLVIMSTDSGEDLNKLIWIKYCLNQEWRSLLTCLGQCLLIYSRPVIKRTKQEVTQVVSLCWNDGQ